MTGQSLNILTYNTGLLVVPFSLRLIQPNPYVRERLNLLPSVIKGTGADVVCLQEVFFGPAWKYIRAQLRSVYPHHATSARWQLLGVGTGLCILSKYPVSEVFFERFQHQCWDERLAVVRGVLGAKLILPDGQKIWMLNTHLIAGGLYRHPDIPKMRSIRARQIEQYQRIRAELSLSTPVIAGGDFNCGPQVSKQNFADAIGDGLDAHSEVGDDQGAVTWDPTQPLNRTTLYEEPPQRIDHVMIDRGTFQLVSSRVVCTEYPVSVRNSRGGIENVPGSDHYGLSATLLYT